jgi:signal transduction histidine kinase
MKKSIWIFLLAVLVPGVVLGWLALRSAEEQQIIFERRTAQLYQKETETLAATVRETVEGERRAFGETVRRLLANSDAEALARDFSNTLADAWPRRAIGFALDSNGKLLSPTLTSAKANPEWRSFVVDNGAFLSGAEPATVYAVQFDAKAAAFSFGNRMKSTANPAQDLYFDEQRLKKAAPLLGYGGATAGLEMESAGAKPADAPGRANDKDKDGTTRLELTDAVKLHDTIPEGLATTADKAAAENVRILAETTSRGGVPATAAAPPPAPPALRREALGEVVEQKTQAPGKDASKKPAVVATAGDEPALLVKEAADLGAKRRAMPVPAQSTPLERYALKPDAAPAPVPAQAPAAPEPRPQAAAAPLPRLARSAGREVELTKQTQVEAKNEELEKLSQNRMVEPQQLLGAPSNALSTLVPATTEFRSLTEGNDEGMISRFVQDKLDLIFWIRPPEAPEMIFGCLVEAANLAELWTTALAGQPSSSSESYGESNGRPEYVLALLDDRGKPAARRPASGAVHDWKRPFVASEVGEALPHWEAALYLANPTALAEGARGLRRTLTFTIVGAVALIALGGWLVVADARRQLALAQQKTDFVSNVSHELKTPLTSIRMFAELMHDRPPPPEKQGQYLRIITVEAERLTRLINNVLDFAKIGRRQKRYEKKPLDLHGVISRVWESQELHLREAGFQTRWDAAPGPYPVLGDEDAIAQLLVNLLSNAEKYSTGRKEVELHTWLEDGWVNVTVLDRGMGVPKGEERKIFEAFYRAHDSLSSGIQGSGLGLTLARHVAHEHGGEIRFERREDGGSRFTLRLPLTRGASAEWKVEGGK